MFVCVSMDRSDFPSIYTYRRNRGLGYGDDTPGGSSREEVFQVRRLPRQSGTRDVSVVSKGRGGLGGRDPRRRLGSPSQRSRPFTPINIVDGRPGGPSRHHTVRSRRSWMPFPVTGFKRSSYPRFSLLSPWKTRGNRDGTEVDRGVGKDSNG